MKFRPRFSVRTLAIFVTLVCAYFAAWEATKHAVTQHGYKVLLTDGTERRVQDRNRHFHELTAELEQLQYELTMAGHGDCTIAAYAKSPAPLIMSRMEVRVDLRSRGPGNTPTYPCYVWLFGPMVKLPFDSGRLR